MVAIKYRNPRRPGEAYLVLLPDSEQSQAEATRERLARRGFVIVMEDKAPRRSNSYCPLDNVSAASR